MLEQQGRDAVVATLAPGHLAWDEEAINAGAAGSRGIAREDESAYYEAYARAARQQAEAIRDEDDADAITDDQIRVLQQEAGQAGDAVQVEVCAQALDGDERARRVCATVIREASLASAAVS